MVTHTILSDLLIVCSPLAISIAIVIIPPILSFIHEAIQVMKGKA